MRAGRSCRAIWGAVLLGLAGGACGTSSDTVRVAAAASLQEVVEELGTSADVAGSATLARQIIDGAPVDVFLSADPTTMQAIVDAGLVDGEPVVFARNGLVLVTPAGNPADVTGLGDMGRSELLVGRCADDVPCGRLALGELAESGVADAADTEEPDVRSLLAKVRAGELDVALVYRTDAVVAGSDVVTVEDDRLDRRNVYVGAVLTGERRAEGHRFLDRLTGPDGRAVLAGHGFEVP